MDRVFLSYRRQDTAWHARLLTKALKEFGAANVFYDVEDLAPGADFSSQLHDALLSASVVLVLIGPEWLTATDASGKRRIDDPTDFIRTEIAAALQQGKPVVPILVDGARMPSLEELPDELRDLGYRNAIELRNDTWDRDVARLWDALTQWTGGRKAAGATAPTGDSRGASAGAIRPPFFTRLKQAIAILRGGTPVMERPAVVQAPRRAHQVFVSYSTKDSRRADKIVTALEGRGKMCWMAPRDIPPGVTSWAEPIVVAIASSKLVLVLLTEHSIPSVDVLREVTLAADEKIPLLAVSLDGSPLSPGLRYFFVAGQRLDVGAVSLDEQVRSILPAVEQQLPSVN